MPVGFLLGGSIDPDTETGTARLTSSARQEASGRRRVDPHDSVALQRRIRLAFARVPQHDTVLRHAQSTPKDAAAAQCFADIPWRAVREWMLKQHEQMLTSFTPEAFRQFLPVWLLGALGGLADRNTVLDVVLDALSPSAISRVEGMRDLAHRLSFFNKAQLAALECFLQNVMLDPDRHVFFRAAQKDLHALRQVRPSILKARLSQHVEWFPFCAIKHRDGSTIAGANLRRLEEFVADIASELDLTGADLAGLKLADVSIEDGRLQEADLTGTDLRRARLRRADLRGAILTGARLRGADLTLIKAEGARLANADLRECRLYGADLQAADLTGSDLRGADLRRAKILRWQLDEAKLDGSCLRGASIYE